MIGDLLQPAADKRQAAVKSDPLLFGKVGVDLVQHPVYLLSDFAPGFPAFFGKLKKAVVPFGAFALAGKVAVGLQIVHRTGDCGLVLFAFFAKGGGGKPLGKIQVVQRCNSIKLIMTKHV